MSGYRVAMDIGGTFTDFVVVDGAAAETISGKVLTTPADPAARRARRLASVRTRAQCGRLPGARNDRRPERVPGAKGHASPADHDRGAPRLVLDRPARPERALRAALPQAQASSATAGRRRGCASGCAGTGRSRRRSAPESLEPLFARIRDEGVEAVAVCLIHSYVNPEHELQVRDLLRAEFPELSITLSHEIAREWREYERASSAVLNAYIAPRVERYLATLERELGELEVSTLALRDAVERRHHERPKRAPRADSNAALRACRGHDRRCGTRPRDRTTQPSLHRHGRNLVRPQPRRRREADSLDRNRARGPARADAARRHPHDRCGRRVARVARGGGPARRTAERRSRSRPGMLRPWRDAADGHGRQPLPRSARLGLFPRRPDDARRERGRACARVGLGTGRARNDRARRGDARDRQREDGGRNADDHRQAGDRPARVCPRRVRRGRPDACRLARRGARDRRGDRALEPGHLLRLGDAADGHAPRRGAELLSAARRTARPTSVAGAFVSLEAEGAALLEAEGIDAADRYVARSADMRYVGQEYTVNVLVGATISLEQIDADFHDAHRIRYGHATPGAPVEFVNLRLAALGRIATAERRSRAAARSRQTRCSGRARSSSTARGTRRRC